MIHAMIYHGFALGLKAGRLERQFYHSIINQIDSLYPNERNLVINGTWLNWDFQHQLEALLTQYSPTQVFIGSMVDAWNMDSWAQEKFPNSKIFVFGNADNELNFNYWAIHCNHYFENFSQEKVRPDNLEKIYLCYQNKPKLHRQMLAVKLVRAGLKDCGVLTLQKFANHDFLYPDLEVMEVDDNFKYLICRSDNSDSDVGKLDIWNRCFLNIVSESEFENIGHTFISEKTWKPILGLRPFVIHGESQVYTYLKKHGFDVFEDLFPVHKIEGQTDHNVITDVIVDTVKWLQTEDLNKLYSDITPRLLYNQQRLEEFANEQEFKINHLFKE